jgi:CRP/FNR family cyclic AMP-dependent transcriptional regulator
MLEGLATAAESVSVEPLLTVLREGEESDALYVIVSGEVRVTSSGEAGGPPRDLGPLGPGGYFGEIGLLQGIPRTATVTAVTPAELLRITGEDFLRIVNEGPGVSSALRNGMTRRLDLTHPSRAVGKL